MDDVKKKNRKVVGYSIFAAVTIILCYMFVVLYFFYMSPFNIALKINLWPLLSKKGLGEIYRDATVEISWTYEGGIEPVDLSVVGVNVREDGVIIAPYNDLRGCEESGVKIMTNSGKTYAGKLLFGDMNYDLAVLKCENISGNAKIRMPYVRLGSSSKIDADTDIIAVSSPLERKNVWTSCELESEETFAIYSPFDLDGGYVYDYKEGYNAVDYVLYDCFGVKMRAFTSGAFFDRRGNLLGLSNGGKLRSEAGKYECDILIPIDGISNILDDVLKAYKRGEDYSNQLVASFKGMDYTETYCHFLESSKENSSEENRNGFYFAGEWRNFDENLRNFYAEPVEGVFLVEAWKFGEEAAIAQANVIHTLKFKGETHQIVDRNDLIGLLYQMKDGDEFVVGYAGLDENELQFVTVRVGGEANEKI